jgi:hypothetical protein
MVKDIKLFELAQRSAQIKTILSSILIIAAVLTF